jgi:excisionase family DNA binding protein
MLAFVNKYNYNSCEYMIKRIINQEFPEYVSTLDAAQNLGIKRMSIHALIRSGRLPAVKIANRWLIPKKGLEEFAKTYEGKKGRPRLKRKYTKRSPKWRKEL